jgi:hypothetical protein
MSEINVVFITGCRKDEKAGEVMRKQMRFKRDDEIPGQLSQHQNNDCEWSM